MEVNMVNSQGTVACPRLLYSDQKFDQYQFFVWVAIHRNTSSSISPEAKLSCPLGGYWCEDCKRVEYLGQQNHPTGDNRRRRMARKFGNTCSKMVTAASNKLNRQKNTKDNIMSPWDPDEWSFPRCELDATEIYELPGCSEVQGLLTGVQYLDTMSTALDRSVGYHECGPSPNSGLDFTRPETFQFLKAAASDDEREPKNDCDWSSLHHHEFDFEPAEMPGCGASCLHGNHPLDCIHGQHPTTARKHQGIQGSSLNSNEMHWVSSMVNAFQTHKALTDIENDTNLRPPSPQQAKRANYAHKARCSTKNPRNQKDGPQIAQWVTLWRLRHDLRELYDKLTQAAELTLFPGARKVRRLYRDATHMLQVGLATFETVLEGVAPSSLQKVLAFICISKVMWNTVKRKGHGIGISAHDPLDNLRTWRLAVRDAQDRAVLDQVANTLWNVPMPGLPSEPQTRAATRPSSYTDMSSMLLVATPSDSAFFDVKEPLGPDVPFESIQCHFGGTSEGYLPLDSFSSSSGAEDLAPHFHNEVDLLLAETSAHDEIRFSDFLHIPHSQMTPSRPEERDVLGSRLQENPGTNTCWDFTSNYFSPELRTAGVVPFWNDFNLTNGTISPMQLNKLPAPGWDPPDEVSASSWLQPPLPNNSNPGKTGQDDEKGLIKMLIGTLMFQVVVTFLRSLVDCGPLLRILTGCTRAQPPEACDTPDKSKARLDGEFIQALMGEVVGPLRLVFGREDRQLLGVLSMAESMIRSGAVSSLRDFEDYVLHVGVHFSKTKDSFMSMVRSVLQQCLTCSKSMIWNHVYGDDASGFEEYSDQYVASREFEETQVAEVMFADPVAADPRIASASPGLSVEQNTEGSTSNTQSGSPHSSPVSTLSTETSLSQRIEICTYTDCGKVFRGRDAAVNLRRHMRCTHESSDKNRTCPGSKCDYKTARRDNLRRHFLKKHHNERMPDWLRDRKRS
ncbi:hypothetical protein HJFPF1_05765 [Paramyrothecium foliicola]|nr:hypothetical protein HJFPF1_05765 [Paramyrothecium foliicola]